MIENQYIKIWTEDDIMFGYYKVDEVDLEVANHMITTRVEACGEKTYPFLGDVSSVKTITKDARSAFAEGDGIKNMNACALVVGSPVNRLLGNFFLSVSKPTIPTRLFTSHEDALTWLSTFKKEKVD